MQFLALLQAEVSADPTGGLLGALPSVAGAAGGLIVVVFLFLRHLDGVHTRHKETVDKALALLGKVADEHEGEE